MTATEGVDPLPGAVLCMIPGPDREMKREPAGDLWCFGERKRLPHDWVLMGDSDPRSYYDPEWHRQCSGCGKDKTAFGSSRW